MIAFIAAFALSLLLIPGARGLSFRTGRVAQPRPDRWNSRPTPTLGGIGIFVACGLALVVAQAANLANGARPDSLAYGFLAGSALMFLLGLYDDFRDLSPSAKLVGQIVAATLVISLGYTSTFFSARVDNRFLAQTLDILFTYIWLIGITNAINLLDNMDGLAGGIAVISASVLAYFFWDGGNLPLWLAALALAGSLLGFLVYNFPPARIFMGDSGSLFIGFTLAVMAIAHQKQQASNVLAVLGVPLLVFLLPILDTALVTFTRLLRGQSPAQGGRDHTSHRLVAFGLSERQAVLVLYAVALVSAVTAAVVEALNYWLSLALAPLLIVSLTLLAAWLGKAKVVSASSHPGRLVARLLGDLTYRRRVLEVLLDFVLIALAYYLAFLTHFGLGLNADRLELYLQTVPLALLAGYLVYFAAGVYRGLWRYVGLDDLLRYALTALGSAALLAGLVYLFRLAGLAPWQGDFPDLILALFAVFLLLGLSATRLSFRLLDRLAARRPRSGEQTVLILGAGDAGELALRWIIANPQLGYRTVGFLDSDPLMRGRSIHGVEVLGDLRRLDELLARGLAAGVILAQPDIDPEQQTELSAACRRHGGWLRRLRLELDEVSEAVGFENGRPEMPARNGTRIND